MFQSMEQDNWVKLYNAIKTNQDIEQFADLIQPDDVHRTDGWGYTLLHLAITHKNYEAAKLLCSKGSNVHIGNTTDATPFHLALRYLKKKDVNKFLQFIDLLLSHGANINKTCKHGTSPLMLACTMSTVNRKLIQGLISRGANINQQNNEGKTPLHSAT